jgi:AcrR family transcriptional regulator
MDITREKIVQAALEILNRKGIGSLSMRVLADKLDIKAASLYWHISNKTELYGLIAEHICTQIQLPNSKYRLARRKDAKKYLLELNLQYRKKLLETRDSAAIFTNSDPVTPRRKELIKTILDSLRILGVKPGNCLAAANMLNHYVLSFIADEFRFKDLSRKGMDIAGTFGNQFVMASNFDDQFLYGIGVLLSGFAA